MHRPVVVLVADCAESARMVGPSAMMATVTMVDLTVTVERWKMVSMVALMVAV